MSEVIYRLTDRQKQAFWALLDDQHTSILYGGAKGGGKSFLLCLWAYHYVALLCQQFALPASQNPLPVGFLGRKRSVDFRTTTLETWRKIIPADRYTIREQHKEIIIDGKAKIVFGGLDNQDTINKFNSAELAFFALDQAEETTREDVSVLRGSLRLKYNGVQPLYKELYTANPSDCWLKEDFVDQLQPGSIYIPALPSDNPHLPDNYIDTLETAFKYSQPLLRAYKDGDWHSLRSSNTLLSSGDIEALNGLVHHNPIERRVIVCDPATSHDECVIYYIKDYSIEERKILVGERDTMKIAGEIVAMARRFDVKDVGGDVIGLGQGIFDRIAELSDFSVHRLNSAASSTDKRFLNLRAEMYWRMMELVIDKRIYYPLDEELRRQLINVTYEVTNSSGTIKITDKDKIKKVLGVSPDRADAFVYGVYLMDSVESYKKAVSDVYSYDSGVEDYTFTPATV